MRFAAFTIILATSAFSAEPKLTTEQVNFFESKVRPVLVENCYKCHSEASDKVKGGLLLDSRDGWSKGGDSGPAIVPGQPDKSLLIRAVRYTDKDLAMPPNEKKLPPNQIADLETWVRMGAPDPRIGGAGAEHVYKVEMENARKHWAYKRITKPAVPAVSDPWIKSPVDTFILASLKANNLTPSKPADKTTLLRRATFDLTGLPPTTKELQDFLADNSPSAFSNVVERLLGSPRYGERWGRYWLDLAKYGDTKGRVGQNEDPRYLYSHTYRDYVIRSFNDDLPFDKFIVQQIAADKLQLGEDKRALAALGFLTLGNRFNNNAQDIIDDRLDTIFKSTMALTVACARCHDHKFDPIPTRDYYALHGVLNSSTEPKEQPLIDEPKSSPAYQAYLRDVAFAEAAVERYRDEIARELSKDLRGKVGDYLFALYEFKKSTNGQSLNRFMQTRNLSGSQGTAWQRYLQERRGRQNHPVFSPWFEFETLTDAEFPAKARELSAKFYANKDRQFPINAHVARLFVSPPASMKQLAARYGVMFSEIEKKWETLLATTKTPPAALPDPAAEEVRKHIYGRGTPGYIDDARVRNYINREDRVRNRLNQLQRTANDLKFNHPGSPARAHVLIDSDRPRDSAILVKGNPGKKGPVVQRQFLEFVSTENRKPFRDGSGRLELAQAIVHPDNPLTTRVLVNRAWLQHFGQGLVRTADDFGLRSDPPTHPELLDYLATWFVENGWSLKKLHRLLMLSSAYQQSSDENPRFAQIDPENRYLWQMNRRRLDFEALRDTILYIGGKLDVTMGGPGVRLDSEPYSLRRSVYGYVDRNNLPNMYLTFDFANPDLATGKRDETIIPQQALFMMNSPLVVEQAENLARRPDFKAKATNEEKIKLLYNLIYQREPTALEVQLATEYLRSETVASAGAGQAVWEYGFGEYDATARRVKNFVQLPTFSGNAWTAGNRGARSRTGNLRLTAEGGQSGNAVQYTAIRRWNAPRDGYIAIDGTLGDGGKNTDGVHGWVVSSTTGQLGMYFANNNQVPAKLPRVLVKKGDAIDFVAMGRSAFNWAPEIKYVDGHAGKVWNAQKDFSGTLPSKNMDAWEKFAQVLLQTNELTFVN